MLNKAYTLWCERKLIYLINQFYLKESFKNLKLNPKEPGKF